MTLCGSEQDNIKWQWVHNQSKKLFMWLIIAKIFLDGELDICFWHIDLSASSGHTYFRLEMMSGCSISAIWKSKTNLTLKTLCNICVPPVDLILCVCFSAGGLPLRPKNFFKPPSLMNELTASVQQWYWLPVTQTQCALTV